MSDLESSDILKVSNGLQQIISNVSSVNYDRLNLKALVPSIKKVESALQQYHEHTNKNAVAAIKILNENNYQNIMSMYSQTNLNAMKSIHMDSLSKVVDSLNFIQRSYKMNMNELSKNDFRIGVATQELEQVFTEEPEVVTENLLFKKTSEPVNELESQLFDILNQQRKILNDNSKILKEMNDSKSENITQKQSDKKHDSPAFYKDKMWYFEQVGATLIGLVVNEIINRTIGVNPHNTVLLAMFLRRFLRFLK